MIGNVIKLERNKQGMKQKVLAKGICSPAYLCKIENNQAHASQEIIALLLERLNLSLDIQEQPKEDFDYRKELLKIYEDVTKARTISFAEEKYNYLLNNKSYYLSSKSYYDYNLILLYLLIIAQKSQKEIDPYFSLIEDQKSLNKFQLYILNKCLGIQHYNLKEYEKASNYFNEALYNFPQKYFDSYERADLCYMNSLAKIANSQYFSALELVDYSIKYFKDNIEFSRLIECLILEGICFQRLKNFEKSSKIYLQALKLSNHADSLNFKSLIFQNLGSVNANIGDLDLALKYYMNSFDLRETPEEQLITIFSIVQIYSRKKNLVFLEKWVKRGVEISRNKELFKSYYYHFNMYQQLYFDFNDMKLIDEALQYFEENKDYRHIYKYGIKIAEILSENNKYKQANTYYKRAILFKNINLLYWEDL